MISFVLMTRNCPRRLMCQVRRLCAAIARARLEAEIVIFDNGSLERPILDTQTQTVVKYVHLEHNHGVQACMAAPAVAHPDSDWLVLLDSHTVPWLRSHTPLDRVLEQWDGGVGVVSADLYTRYPDGVTQRCGGGLPEVARLACAAVRRSVLERASLMTGVRGFAAELDFAASVLRQNMRTVFDPRLVAVRRMRDRRSDARQSARQLGRCLMDRLRVVHACAPAASLDAALERTLRLSIRRAGRWISDRELGAWEKTVAARLRDVDHVREPLTQHQWDRLTGVQSVRTALLPHVCAGTRVALIAEGDDAWAVEQVIEEFGGALVSVTDHPDFHVIGALEPGVVLDAMFAHTITAPGRTVPVLCPWMPMLPGETGTDAVVAGAERAAA